MGSSEISLASDIGESPTTSIRCGANRVWTTEQLMLLANTSQAFEVPLWKLVRLAEEHRPAASEAVDREESIQPTNSPQTIAEEPPTWPLMDNAETQFEEAFQKPRSPMREDPEHVETSTQDEDTIDSVLVHNPFTAAEAQSQPAVDTTILTAEGPQEAIDSSMIGFGSSGASKPIPCPFWPTTTGSANENLALDSTLSNIVDYSLTYTPTFCTSMSTQVSSSGMDATMPQEAPELNLADNMPTAPFNGGSIAGQSRFQGLEDTQGLNIADQHRTLIAAEGPAVAETANVGFSATDDMAEPIQDADHAASGQHKCRRQQVSRRNGSSLQNPTRKRIKLGKGERKCMKCAIEQKRCNPTPDGPCERCAGFKYSTPECVYTKIIEIELFRVATQEFLLIPELGIDQEIISRAQERNSGLVKTISITQGLELPERQRNLYSVPFALRDLEASKRTMQKFVYQSVVPYLKVKLTGSDQISRSFFELGFQLAQPKSVHSSFVLKVLYLWTAARMMEGGWHFCGSETLGLPRNSKGIIEIVEAPFVDYQFAGIMRDFILFPLREKVLQELQSLIYHKHHKLNWLCVTIASFVLLNTYGHFIQQQKDVAEEWGLPTRYPSMRAIHGIHHGAKVLLKHYHNGIKGQKVFDSLMDSPETAKRDLERAGVEPNQIRALAQLAPKIRAKVPTWADLVNTEEYGKEHWFTGQLFLRDWREPNTIEHMPPA